MAVIDNQRLARVLDLKNLDLPATPRVLEIQGEPYVDWLGDDALRILVVLDDALTDDEIWQGKLRPIELSIFAALAREGIDLFPYIFFARQSERAALEQS